MPRTTAKIAVLMGGPSSERDVSLDTGKNVLEALQGLGYDAVGIDWQPGQSLPALLAEAKIEVVWNALHGTFGEDGAVQGLLSCMGIPCTGSGVLASAMAMDKVASKGVFRAHDIRSPKHQVWNRDGDQLQLPLPVVVKPSNEGSSVGVSLVFEEAELEPAIELAARHKGDILIEEYIPGKEVFIGILDDQVIGSVEVRPASGFYDYEAKYQRNDTQYIVPAPIDAELLEELGSQALAAHRALGCSTYSRVDVRVTDEGQGFVLEVNTLPGMTSSSLMPKIAKHAGIDYPTLCERILLGSLP